MRKTIVIALLIGLFLLMAGCGGGATPKGAVDGFMVAAKDGDMAAMKSSCTGPMLEFWGLLEEMKKMEFPGADMMDITAELTDAEEIKVEEKEVSGDTAKVDVTVDEDTITYIMVKTGGKWLISDMETPDGLLSKMLPDLKEAIEEFKNMPDMPEMPEFVMPDMPDMPDMPHDEGDSE